MNSIDWNIQNNFRFENPDYTGAPINNAEEEIYFFKTSFHTFKAIVKRKDNTIRIGGQYDNCVNITIDYEGDNSAILSYIESEPECALDSFLEDGQGSDMLKGSLQFVNSIFPNMKLFYLDDMSQIECGSNLKLGFPPRKKQLPLSLPYLSIATNGKTWYEKYFNAKHRNSELYNRYRNGVRNLLQPIKDRYESFDVFAKYFRLSEKNIKIIEPFFDPEQSWQRFFQSIPRASRCDAFYNWLEDCINIIINSTFIPSKWVIDIDTMPKTTVEIVQSLTRSNNTRKNGGKRRSYIRRTTRKAKKSRIFLSHKRYHGIM